MGNSRWDNEAYLSYSSEASLKSRDELFARRSTTDTLKGNQELEPEKIQYRESRDSELNPKSCPIMIGLDVSGSMGVIAEHIAKGGLGTCVEELLQRKPVDDPHILFMGIGDACANDNAPLQVTQFEADNSICDQLTDIWLEGRGGGNAFESYDLAWAMAAYKTQTDQWEKRNAKGYLFTMGDELFPRQSDDYYMKKVFDKGQCSPERLLEDAQERYHVFHLIIAQGSYASGRVDTVERDWEKHLGKRVLTVINYDYVAEVVVSAIAVAEGRNAEDVVNSWNDKKAQETVRQALFGRNPQR